jgi:hypothetical protein
MPHVKPQTRSSIADRQEAAPRLGAANAAKRIRRIRQPDGTEEFPTPQSESAGFAGQGSTARCA